MKIVLERALRCCAALVVVAALSISPGWAAPASGPPLQAEPLGLGESLPNLYRVSDELFRGAQPKEQGFDTLRRLGVRTVVNVRPGHEEAVHCLRSGLRYIEIPMRAWRFEEQDVVRFLEIVSSAGHEPVFVHCRRGADRTGMLVAVYRVVVEGWSRESALEEMTRGPYGYNRMWKKLVRFVKNMDVDRLRRAAGLDGRGDPA